MNKTDFFNSIFDMVKATLSTSGIDASVETHEVAKPNGITLTGLIVKDSASNIAPTIYLDDYYKRFSDGLLSLEDATSEIIDVYSHHKKDSIGIGWIQDFAQVKDKIIPCICNASMNEEYLKSHPSTSFLDLSIYYRIQVSDEIMRLPDSGATIAVTNQLADMWNINADDLFTLAFHNAKSISPASFKTMAEIMCEMMADTAELPEDVFESNPMFVLSNTSKTNGAIWMVDSEVLSTIATQLDDDFYLLPSSRHEIILVPASVTSDEQNLKDMIREVNDTQVSEEDLLSYSLYRYHRDIGELQIA